MILGKINEYKKKKVQKAKSRYIKETFHQRDLAYTHK